MRRYPDYKDSGVEWIGEIPSHWTAPKIKFVANVQSGHTPSRKQPEYWEDCVHPWFTLQDVWQLRDERTTVVTSTKEKISDLGLANSSARMLPEGTVILSRTASVGYSGVLGREMATSQDFVCWVCGPKLDPMYLLFGLRAMRREFGRLLTGSTHKTIYMPDAYDFQIPLPPLPEQEELVSFIKRKVDEIDALLHKYTGGVVVKEVDKGGQRGLVSLLLELRRNLTFEVVTGKVDVRSDALAEPVIDTEEVAA